MPQAWIWTIFAFILLFNIWIAKVFRDSFIAAMPDMITISDKLINGTVAAQLTASLIAVSCITVTFPVFHGNVVSVNQMIGIMMGGIAVFGIIYYFVTLLPDGEGGR